MNKIKRGVSLLLCSLLFGSAVTLGNVADVQAGKQIKTETKQTINNTKTKKKVSDDQTSGKTGRNEENKAGEGAQTDIAESKVTFSEGQKGSGFLFLQRRRAKVRICPRTWKPPAIQECVFWHFG